MTVTDLRHLTLPLAATPCWWCAHTGGTAYWTPAGAPRRWGTVGVRCVSAREAA